MSAQDHRLVSGPNRTGGPSPATDVADQPQFRITGKDARYGTIVALFAWIFSVYDYILFGTLLPQMSEDFGWSSATSTRIVTFVSIGTFFVALAVGPMVDRVGRRRGLIITTVGAAVSSGLTGLTPSAAAGTGLTVGILWLIAVRAVSGLGYSEQAVNSTYLNELYAAAERTEGKAIRKGLIYSLVQAGWPLGVLFAAAMTAMLLPSVGWRGVFLIATFPAVVIAFLGKRLKETPQFLQMRQVADLVAAGRAGEARAAAARYGLPDPERQAGPSVPKLFRRGQARHTLFLSSAFLLNWVGVQVFAVLGTTVLTESKDITFGNSLTILIASNAAGFLGYLSFGAIGDKIGRRPSVVAGWICASVSFSAMLYLAENYLAVLLTYSVGLFFLIGPYSALLFYIGESYPTHLRGTGTAFANAMGPVGAICGSALFSALLSSGVGVTHSAAISGAMAITGSALMLLGARRVSQTDTAAAAR